MNRFGFALEGSRCAFDRIYYDALHGQLKKSIPRWEGLQSTIDTLGYIKNFFSFINIPNNEGSEESDEFLSVIYLIKELIDSSKLKIKLDLLPDPSDFKGIYDDIFIDYFHRRENILKNSLNILAMVYFCLFLIAATAAGVSMMFYACLKRQGYLITFMHVLWNVIRFFIFSFFLFGTAYGVLFDILSDLIGVMKMIFENNLSASPEGKPNKINFLKKCLSLTDSEDSSDSLFLDEAIRISVIDYFDNLNTIVNCYSIIGTGDQQKAICDNLLDDVKNKKLGSFNCSFLESDLNHLYKALDDASSESQKLSAISLCAAFFGAVAIYFYLLVIHHYNNELFFDSGKSIFTGFDGFGRGFKNKNRNNDPAYKKRKLRAEIELTSKNDDQNEYNNINKNDD